MSKLVIPDFFKYQAVELAYKVYKGESVSDVYTGAKWYNADNMNGADIKDLLYD